MVAIYTRTIFNITSIKYKQPNLNQNKIAINKNKNRLKLTMSFSSKRNMKKKE